MKAGPIFGGLAPHDGQRDVRALVLDVAAALDEEVLRGEALVREFCDGCRLELGQGRCRGLAARPVEWRLERALPQGAHVGEAHAVGAEHAGERVEEHATHAEGVGHQAGVLPGGAAEAAQDVVADVVTPLGADAFDRSRHGLAGHPHEVVGELLGRRRLDAGGAHARGHGRERLARRLLVEGPGAVRPEHAGEEGRPQLAGREIAVRDGQRAALAVARRPGVGPGAARPDAVATVLEGADRAASGGDGVDAQHRRTQLHAADHALEAALQLSRVVRDVGRGAAHVEGDDPVVPGAAAGGDRADHTAGGAREDAVLAAEQAGVGESSVRLHETQAHVAQLRREGVDVAAQDGGEVGVDHGRLAAPDELDQRARLVRDGDLGEAGGARQLRHAPFVFRVGVAVHEGDGDRFVAGAAGLAKAARRALLVERAYDVAVGADALVHLEDSRVHRLRQPDVECEDVRPVLVADAQGVAEAACGHVQRRRPGALEQRVGRHRRAHAHLGDELRRHQFIVAQPEQLAHPLDGGVRVPRRVLREQLTRDQAAVGPPCDDIGECAAAVDPEAPALGLVRASHSLLVAHHPARLPRAPSATRAAGLTRSRVERWRADPGVTHDHRHQTGRPCFGDGSGPGRALVYSLAVNASSPGSRLREAADLLDDFYGRPVLSPRYPPVDELVFTVLSQNTADVNTERTFASLKERFPEWTAARDAAVEVIEEAIALGGLAHTKAPRIKRILEAISERTGAPDLSVLDGMTDGEAQAYLVALPGVGPKTAACVLLFALERPVMPVDTHVHRVARRLGIIAEKVSAEQAHPLLTELAGPDDAAQVYAVHVDFVRHGRRICHARRPKCGECPLAGMCPSAGIA